MENQIEKGFRKNKEKFGEEDESLKEKLSGKLRGLRRYRKAMIVALSAASIAVGINNYRQDSYDKPNESKNKIENSKYTPSPLPEIISSERWQRLISELDQESINGVINDIIPLHNKGIIDLKEEEIQVFLEYQSIRKSVIENKDFLQMLAEKNNEPCSKSVYFYLKDVQLQQPDFFEKQETKRVINIVFETGHSINETSLYRIPYIVNNIDLFELEETRDFLKKHPSTENSISGLHVIIDILQSKPEISKIEYIRSLNNLELIENYFGVEAVSWDDVGFLCEKNLEESELKYVRDEILQKDGEKTIDESISYIFFKNIYVPYLSNNSGELSKDSIRYCIDSLYAGFKDEESFFYFLSNSKGGEYFQTYYNLLSSGDSDSDNFKEIILRIPWESTGGIYSPALNLEMLLDNYKSFKYLKENTFINEREDIGEFLSDSLLPVDYMNRLGINPETDKILELFESKTDKYEAYARTIRAMNLERTPPTRENFSRYLLGIENLRNNEKIRSQEVFSNRNILGFFHNESNNIFGKKELIDALKRQGPDSIYTYRAETDGSNLEEVKQKFINDLTILDNPTVIIDAHGSPDAVYLSDGTLKSSGGVEEDSKTGKVTVTEVYELLKKRFSDNKAKGEVMLIVHSCFSYNFLRNLFDQVNEYNRNLKDTKSKIKISFGVSASEYSQISYSSKSSKLGTLMFDRLFIERGGKTTLGDLIDIESEARNIKQQTQKQSESNISIFLQIDEEVIHNFGDKKAAKANYLQIAEKFEGPNDIHYNDALQRYG